MAYVDGHVYLAGFTQGNASFHSVHVTNGPTGPATDPDKVTVDHASPEDGETAIMYKITDEGVFDRWFPGYWVMHEKIKSLGLGYTFKTEDLARETTTAIELSF